MANLGIAPVTDYTLPVSLVRVLIGDTNAANINNGIGEYTFFSDAEIIGILSMYSTNTAPGSQAKRAAAQILRAIATSQVLLLKVFKSDDLESNGDKISEAIRKNAADLVADAANEDLIYDADIFDYNSLPQPWPLMEGGYTPVTPYTFYERYLPPQMFR